MWLPLLAWTVGCGGEPRVVVIGGGPAGMAAAIEARARVAVVLFEARQELGGSMTYGDAITAVPSPAALAELDAAAGHPNPARARFVAQVKPEVIDWFGAMGVSWMVVPNRLDDGSTLYGPAGRGPRLAGALIGTMERLGVDVRKGSFVERLSRGRRWTVHLRGGGSVRADAVVVATGGFAGDVARVREKLGLGDVPLLRGGPAWADGNGIGLATAVGAVERTPGEAVLYAHGIPDLEDPGRAIMLIDALRVYPVDASGAYLAAVQSPRGDSGLDLLRRPEARAWAILDRPGIMAVRLWDPDKGQGRPAASLVRGHGLQVDTLEELATRLGVSVESLRAGLAVDRPSPERPLQVSDRYGALPLRITAAKTLSGLLIDLDGRCLDATGAPIPGLYAAGEVAGFAHPWEGRHIDSTMVSGAVLTGRAAGRAAGSWVSGR